MDFKKIELIKISKIIFGKYYKDPSNKNTKYLRTRIRNLKEILETSGINYDQVIKSIKNLASSKDTLDQYFNQIYILLAIEVNDGKQDSIVVTEGNRNNNPLSNIDKIKIKLFKYLLKKIENIM